MVSNGAEWDGVWQGFDGGGGGAWGGVRCHLEVESAGMEVCMHKGESASEVRRTTAAQFVSASEEERAKQHNLPDGVQKEP